MSRTWRNGRRHRLRRRTRQQPRSFGTRRLRRPVGATFQFFVVVIFVVFFDVLIRRRLRLVLPVVKVIKLNCFFFVAIAAKLERLSLASFPDMLVKMTPRHLTESQSHLSLKITKLPSSPLTVTLLIRRTDRNIISLAK